MAAGGGNIRGRQWFTRAAVKGIITHVRLLNVVTSEWTCWSPHGLHVCAEKVTPSKLLDHLEIDVAKFRQLAAAITVECNAVHDIPLPQPKPRIRGLL